MKSLIAIAVLALLPFAASALDLTGLPAALAEKVATARQAGMLSGSRPFPTLSPS